MTYLYIWLSLPAPVFSIAKAWLFLLKCDICPSFSVTDCDVHQTVMHPLTCFQRAACTVQVQMNNFEEQCTKCVFIFLSRWLPIWHMPLASPVNSIKITIILCAFMNKKCLCSQSLSWVWSLLRKNHVRSHFAQSMCNSGDEYSRVPVCI